MAASVYGGTDYLQRWRTTDNALEAIAAQHCDGLLILDELAQVDPKTAGECVYMLANEQSKARAIRTGTPSAPARHAPGWPGACCSSALASWDWLTTWQRPPASE